MSLLAYIIWLLIVGFVVGGLARLLVPGTGLQGCISTILLGIVGSLIGGIIGRLAFGDDALLGGFILSFVGALGFALILRLTNRGERKEDP